MKTVAVPVPTADLVGAVRVDVIGDAANIYYPGDNPPAVVPQIDARRAVVITEINAERDRREQGGFQYLGYRIDSDAISVQRMTVAAAAAHGAIAAGLPYAVEWTCADNAVLALDAAGVIGLLQALSVHGAGLHHHARALKALVLASDVPESVDIQSGWPD